MNRLACVLLLLFVGCFKLDVPPSPEPDVPVAGEMSRYFDGFRAAIGKANADTAAEVAKLDDGDELGARKIYGKHLQAAAEAASIVPAEAEAALSEAGWSNAKFIELLKRRERECARGQ